MISQRIQLMRLTVKNLFWTSDLNFFPALWKFLLIFAFTLLVDFFFIYRDFFYENDIISIDICSNIILYVFIFPICLC